MDDLIEQAEAALCAPWTHLELVANLVAALKAAHKEIDWLHGELDRLRVRGDY